MKALSSVFLLLIFCTQMVVFTMERAYCSGKMVKIELNGKPRVCVCDHDVAEPVTDNDAIKSRPCCSSETIHKQFTDLTFSEELEPKSDTSVAIQYPSVHIAVEQMSTVRFVSEPNPPPSKRKSKPFILFGNFKVASVVA